MFSDNKLYVYANFVSILSRSSEESSLLYRGDVSPSVVTVHIPTTRATVETGIQTHTPRQSGRSVIFGSTDTPDETPAARTGQRRAAWKEKGAKAMEKRGGPAGGVNDASAETYTAPSRIRWTMAGILLGLGVAVWGGLTREQGGTSEGLGHAVETITTGVHDATESVRDKLAAAQSSARNLGIEQQISARLHGDKSFDANQIEVHVEGECTAVLRGLVPHPEAKERAVELTQDTKGVLKVVDHLAVVPKPRIITVPQPDQAAEGIENVPTVAGRSRPLR